MTKKLGDPIIALTVVACSVVLLLALAFALQGNPFDRPGRTLRAEFPDITGIQPSSLVKYSGAIAGNVHSIRMLTPEERNASPHPENTVEIVLAINNNVPSLNEGLTASVASDTLLSDKFVLIAGGDPKTPALANDAVIGSITPVTFDAILRDLASVMAKMREIFGSAQNGGLDGILPKVEKLLADLNTTVTQAQGLIGNGNGLIDNAGKLVADGRSLIDTNKDAINRMIVQLSTAADSLDELAKRANKLVKDNESSINSTAKDARETMSDLKAAAASARALAESLRARPQQLIWGPGRPPKPTSN